MKYAIGIDFGTLSGRAVLVSLSDGKEVAVHVTPYPHGVIDHHLPSTGEKLKNEWVLQHPKDYLEVLNTSIPAILKESQVSPNDIVGLGIDFTACTMLPVDQNLTPLCFNQELSKEPHSWVKLWKHHAAQPEANIINNIAHQQNQPFIHRYGGKLSSEWMYAKIHQILNEAPHIYERTHYFVEATDWVVSQLTGKFVRNSCTAGYKAQWHKEEGFPPETFFASLDERLRDLTTSKLGGDIIAVGTLAGTLTAEMAKKTGLRQETAVAVGNVDAHVSVPAMGVVKPGKMVMTMGTSICHLVLSDHEAKVPGMCGVVKDGILEGYYGYEAGQSAVGDIFQWFTEQSVPSYIYEEAKNQQLSLHAYLEQEAGKLNPGESGLLALDWWNGNRSVLVDTELSGMLIGMTLQTKPHEIYRALLESVAFGTRTIIETFCENGIEINELYACGGLPHKNKLLMQIYADICNLPIYITASYYTPAVGSAMFGAVAAGKENGGYATIEEAALQMARLKDEIILPNAKNTEIYNELFKEYYNLLNYFGRKQNDVMRRLKTYKK